MVKIYEVTQEVPFDLIDDTAVWMRNDPHFYRKEFFPAVSKIADMHRNGDKIEPRKHLGAMVEKGINGYCSKYKLARSPEDIFSQTDRDALIDKLFSEEMAEIKRGEYK